MVWTNICSEDFYKRYIRDNKEAFTDETIKEARVIEHQKLLGEFAKEKVAAS